MSRLTYAECFEWRLGSRFFAHRTELPVFLLRGWTLLRMDKLDIVLLHSSQGFPMTATALDSSRVNSLSSSRPERLDRRGIDTIRQFSQATSGKSYTTEREEQAQEKIIHPPTKQERTRRA